MATARPTSVPRRVSRQSSAAVAAATVARTTPPPVTAQRRLVLEYIDINDIVPYDWNPRDNAEAVQSVAASMRLTGGFAMPIVLDDDNVIVAGHTRVEAAKVLGLSEAPVVRTTGMTPEQINAFRLIDNKVASLAKWDTELLAGEFSKLRDTGLDFTDYGWTQGEIDCLQDMVRDDCLDTQQLTENAATATAGHQQRRAPQQARFVLGELTFFIEIGHYRAWADGVRALHNFDEAAITADLKNRLQILE